MQTALTFTPSRKAESLHLQSKLASEPTTIKEGQVRLKTLAAPVNPLDLLVLEGAYPVKPKNHWSGEAIPGYDGVFQVLDSKAPSLTQGDLVIPRQHGFGTWRTHAIANADELQKIPQIDPCAASVLKMGACPICTSS